MSVVMLGLALVSTAALDRTQTAVPTVVCVCEHGAAKSLIASAYFNKLAADRGWPVRASFRGVSPQGALSVRAVAGLRSDGLTIPDQKPMAIDQMPSHQ